MSSRTDTSFVRQAAILGAASIFVRFIGFLYRIPLTRMIGDEGIFFYGAAYSVYGFVLIVTAGTFPAAISKLTSERIARKQYRNAHELFKTAMAIAVLSSYVAALIMWFGADFIAEVFFERPQIALAIRSLAPTVFFVSFLATFRGYFQGMKTAIPTAVSQVVEQVFKVVFSVLLASLFLDAADIQLAVAGASVGTGIAVVAGLAVMVVLYGLISKDLRLRASKDRNIKKYESRSHQVSVIVRTALPMIVGMGIFSIGSFLDLSMAPRYIPFSDDEVNLLIGQFQGKFVLLTTLPVSLSLALSAAVIPEISSSRVQMDISSIKEKANMALRLSMILSIPAAIGLAVLADPIIALLFPNQPDGGWLLRYGAISIVLVSLTHVLTGVLQGLGSVGLPVMAAFFGVAAKVPINYVLMSIPSINILGAVISTIMCYIVAATLSMFFLYRRTKFLPSLGSAIIKPLLASTVMGLACFVTYHGLRLVAPTAVATLVALIVGCVVFVLVMGLIKGFRKKDLQAAPIPNRLRKWLQEL